MTYRARHLLLPPGLLSLSRLPLAACFPFVVSRPKSALGLLVMAGTSDVLDGWIARRFAMTTPTGAAADAVADKIFVFTVAVTLLRNRRLSPASVCLLNARELLELPLVGRLLWDRKARDERARRAAANLPGKLATALQLVAVGAALFERPSKRGWIVATALVGTVAGLSYWWRAAGGIGARSRTRAPRRESWDVVDEVGWESFPASDPPAWY